MKALEKFRIYLLNKPFKLVTDCKAFTQTMDKKDVSARIGRWAIELQHYDMIREHRSGSRMAHVDALSRYPITVNTVTARIKQAQESDDRIQQLKKQVEGRATKDYSVSDGVLYWHHEGRNLVVVPDKLAENIIRTCHEENGHFGKEKVEKIIKQEYKMDNLTQKIKDCVENCLTCLISDRKRGKKEGFLHPIPKEDTPLQTYHLDHLGPMTATDKQYKYVFGVTDAFSKFCWLYATKTTNCNEVIAKLEVQQQVFGNPRRIITDRGSAFTSNQFKEYCEANNIDHILVTTGIPRGNGQIERVNSSIISVLTKKCQEEPKAWYKYLPSVQKVLNSTFNRAISFSPFEVMVGVKMRNQSDSEILKILNEERMEQFANERDKIRDDAKIQICKIQEENRKQHNKKCKMPHEYAIGDLVVIRRTQFGTSMKLKPHYLGPYKVTKVVGNERYDVEKKTLGEGPGRTSTSADNMKLYVPFEANGIQDGRMW